ncbi:MAG: B12-binding domain-containing radical SAM protein [Candidatus Aenigmarchaeota archaeon]|nr:B12-binding domain-containing radical SAM protein [Candidatus Aenigmarchaeota archaeon]
MVTKKIQMFIPEQEYREIKSEGWTRPHGVGIIGTYLRQKGYDVEVFSGVSGTSHREMLGQVGADVVGCTTTIGNYVQALKIVRQAKKVNPNCLTILGGPEATQLYGEVLTNRGTNSRDYCVDVVVCGDGVKTAYELVSGKEWESIPNLAFLSNRELITTPRLREDKNNWPLIDNTFFDMGRVLSTYGRKFEGLTPFRKATSIMSQYGCNSHHCKFCGRTDRQWFGRDTKEVWQEIKELVEIYGAEMLFDFSDSFVQRPEYAEQFLRDKPTDLNPSFRFFARADQLNPQIVQLLKKLGTYEVYIGFESGDQQMLDNMAKGITTEQNLYAAKLLGDFEIKILGSFVLGAPGETKKSLENTVTHAEQIQEVSNGRLEQCLCSVWMPLPGSWGFRQIQKEFSGQDILDLEELKQTWVRKMCDVQYNELSDYVNKVLESSGAPLTDVKGIKN